MGDGKTLQVEAVGSVKLNFYAGSTDSDAASNFCVQLTDVYLVPDIQFNVFSLHEVQQNHEIVLNSTGLRMLDGRLRFDRGT